MDDDAIADLFSGFGAVRVRRMFGGRGLYAEGVMFALEAGGVLYLKADAALADALAARGAEPFSYDTRTGRHTITSYWRVPEAALDDLDDLAALARQALGVALAAAGTTKRKRGGAGTAAGGGAAKTRARKVPSGKAPAG